ncbi:MAG TPA: C-terminal helicase domain-containing protein, partial [Gemmatimonadaceae bacterium]|nr:C-terminal helicase domain-containing protein [Gemmatimonadaceae bacterium]
AERVDLLLSTDLLSEGVNLQAAHVVIHLDLPWTAARLEQRTGRVARLGSPHDTVYVYMIRPPASARQYLESEQIISAKWTIANSTIGNPTPDPSVFARRTYAGQSIPVRTERLRRVLEKWSSGELAPHRGIEPVMASIESPAAGFVAAVRSTDKASIICSGGKGVTADLDCIIERCSSADGREISTQSLAAEGAFHMIEEWISTERASEIAGMASTSELARRRSLLDKIDATVRNAAPHLRPGRTRLAVEARAAATRFLGVAAENELKSLERSALPDDQWLKSVADFQPVQSEQSSESKPANVEIIAVLLLMPPPPASGCGEE